jgi:Holliday junction resolvasome RuvABC DNA-binding subunit
LEFDHIVPLAQGGQSTVENVRLLCHVHNQLVAERVYGAGFMEEKRAAAKRAAEARRTEKSRKAAEEKARAEAEANEQTLDVISVLRNLGFRADQARPAAESTADIPNPTLEARIRAALKFLSPRPYVEPAARATG